MITEETVIITGAGASRPYGYPTGWELREIICDRLSDTFPSNSSKIFNASQYAEVAEHILYKSKEFICFFKDSNVDSIDKYLSLNPAFSDIGKICILLSIFKAEEAPFFWLNMVDMSIKNEDNWLSIMYNELIQGSKGPIQYNELSNNRINFITFNYDRHIEQYLYKSYINTYKEIEQSALLEEFKKLNFFHIYGKIAQLPWQDENCSTLAYGYRNRLPLNALYGMKNNILTMYEERQKSQLGKIYEILKNAKRIFFLGFSYATENVNILKIQDLVASNPTIYGTGLGLTNKEKSKKEALFAIYNSNQIFVNNGRIFLEDCNCTTLLRNYL